MTGISDDVAIILKDAASGYFSLQPGVQGWQGRPCDPEQGTRARHSRFETALDSPAGPSGDIKVDSSLIMLEVEKMITKDSSLGI